MSGGSYDYAYLRVADMADSLRIEGGCRGYCASPALRGLFCEHLRRVAAAMHAIEWNDSGDGDPSEAELIRSCLNIPHDHLAGAVALKKIENIEALLRKDGER